MTPPYGGMGSREIHYQSENVSSLGGLHSFATPLDEKMPFHSVGSLPSLELKGDSLSARSSFAWKSSSSSKLLVLATSIFTLLTSAFLLTLSITDSSSTGLLFSFVSNNRTTAQVAVTIVSTCLGPLNIYTITTLLNFTTRIHLIWKPISLDMLKFMGAVVTRSPVASLSRWMCISSLIIVLLFTIPSILWTGALTPVIVDTTIMEASALKIPQYSTSSNRTWSRNGRIGDGKCITVRNDKGVFGNCPASTIQSSILSRAAQVTSNIAQPHSKIDNSRYSYVGRSYGVGSPVGIVDQNLWHNDYKLVSYNYTEPGYFTQVTCFRNESSTFRLMRVQKGKSGNGIPSIYYAIGSFPLAPPDQGPDFYSIVGLDNDTNIATLAAKRYQDHSTIVVIAGSDYSALNRTQCEVKFTPAMFNVGVDIFNKLIYVKPDTASLNNPMFDPTSGLATTAINQINGLGMIGTTLHTSIIGDALVSNIAGLTSTDKPTSMTVTNSTLPAALAAMADSFSAMLDDVLLFVGNSQFFVPNSGLGDFSSVNANLNVQAVRLGEPKYVFATFGICLILAVAVIVEAFRTRLWSELPKWDFTDTTSLVLASAMAGENIASEVCRSMEEKKLDWAGEGDGAPAEIRLQLGRKVVALAHQSQNGGLKEDWKVELSAVSLRTSNAKDVMPLI